MPSPLQNTANLTTTGHAASVALFCKCGWMIQLFNGDLGRCENIYCEEYNNLYEVSVIVLPVVHENLENSPAN